jgi:hypothetical protein
MAEVVIIDIPIDQFYQKYHNVLDFLSLNIHNITINFIESSIPTFHVYGNRQEILHIFSNYFKEPIRFGEKKTL